MTLTRNELDIQYAKEAIIELRAKHEDAKRAVEDIAGQIDAKEKLIGRRQDHITSIISPPKPKTETKSEAKTETKKSK